MKIIRNFPLFFLPFVLALACASPAVVPLDPNAAPLDPNSIGTAIAGTSMAALTQTAQSNPLIGVKSPTPTLTRIPSPTSLPTFTPVVFVTLVRVTKNTNCRSGPGSVYPAVGVLKVGEVAEAVGRSANARYWIIRNPSRPGTLCWLSAQYASVTGIVGALPVHTPPPTPKPTRTNTPEPKPTKTAVPLASATPSLTLAPAPNFAASYSGMENCAGTDWWVDIRLQNTSTVNTTYRSIALTLTDTVAGIVLSLSADDFTNRNGCSGSDIQTSLPPGGSLIVSGPVLTYDPTGHQLEAMIVLCSDPGQSGMCVMQVINFIP